MEHVLTPAAHGNDGLISSQILNEAAGRTSSRMVHWVVPQLMEAVDNDNIDIDRVLDRVIHGVMHHPAQRHMGEGGISEGRQMCFEVVQEWWQQMDDQQRNDYRRKLSAEGIRNSENHKEGVYDTGHGHGCSGKLQMRKVYGGGPETFEDKIVGAASEAIIGGATGVFSGLVEESTGFKLPGSGDEGDRQEGGGGLGGFLGAASSILGNALGEENPVREVSERYQEDGSFTRTETVFEHQGDRYRQAEYSETRFPGGREETEYRNFEQQESYSGDGSRSYAFEETAERRDMRGQQEERREYGERQGGGGYNQSGYNQASYDQGGYNQAYEQRGSDNYGGGYQPQEESRFEGGYEGGSERRDEGESGGYEQRGEEGYNEEFQQRDNNYGEDGQREGQYGEEYQDGGGAY